MIGKSFDLNRQKMTQEFKKTSGPFKVIFIYLHHVESRVHFLYRKRSHSQIH